MADNIFNFWFLVTVSDAIGAVLAAVLLYRLGTRFGRSLGIFAAAIAFEAVVAGASLVLFFPNEATVAPWFAITRVIGRGVKAAAVWMLALWLLNICQRPREGIHYTVSASRAEGTQDAER
jgi:MFS family permease